MPGLGWNGFPRAFQRQLKNSGVLDVLLPKHNSSLQPVQISDLWPLWLLTPCSNKTEFLLACGGYYWAPRLRINPDYVITLKLSSLNCAEVFKEFDSAGAKLGICLHQQHTSLNRLNWHKCKALGNVMIQSEIVSDEHSVTQVQNGGFLSWVGVIPLG